MKTKLLKLALCAMALLPIGAWADVDFGTQKTVNTTTTWNFASLSGQVGQSAYTAITTFDGVKYYLRAGASNTCEIKDGGSANSQTFADGTVVDARYYVSFNTKWSANPSAMAYAGTDGVKALSALAFNIESAGTCYVKIKGTASDQFRIYYTNPDIDNTYTAVQYASFATGGIDEIAYTASGPGAIMITDNTSAFEIYAVRFVPKSEEPKVSQTTTWTFNGLEAGTYKLNKPIAGNSGDKGYMHASIRSNSSMTVAANSSNDKFGDDTAVSWTKVVTSAGKMQGLTETTISAAFESVTGNYFSPGFAFNTSVPGTCYALISSAESKKVRIYHSDGSSTTNVSTTPSGTEICKLSSGVKAAGTFYVGGVDDAFTIYAVRFVPATYTLDITAENGTVTRSPEKSKYDYNEVVTLTATPAEGYKFVSWSGVDSSEGATATVTMTADKAVTANFEAYAASVNIGSTGYATFANLTGSTLAVPEHLTAYGVSDYTASGVTFTPYNVIPAGVGVILKAEEDYESQTYWFDTTEDACTYSGSNFLVPVTEAKTVPAYTDYNLNYIFAQKTKGVGFYRSSGSGTIAAGKAYLSIKDLDVDDRSWSFTAQSSWASDAANLYTDAKYSSNAGINWLVLTENSDAGKKAAGYNQYKNKAALSDVELSANNLTISRTKGLYFTNQAANRLQIELRNSTTSYINFPAAGGNTTSVRIPNVKPGHTITINAKATLASSASDAGITTGSVTCTATSNVTRTGSTTPGNFIDNVFTVSNSFEEGSLTFQSSNSTHVSINIASITIAPTTYPFSGVEQAREFLGFGDDETTAIEQIESKKPAIDDDAWYTMQGVKVAQPTKGLYIHNGKKIVIK